MTAATPALLVSVRDAAEALDALAGGADWIDLKEPQRGALGPVDAATAHAVATAVAGRAPLSAAAGEVLQWTEAPLAWLCAEPAISHVKFGLAGMGRRRWDLAWHQVADQFKAAGKQLVAVLYADHGAADSPQPEDILQVAVETPCTWALWDTFDKTSGPLLEHLPPSALAAQLAAARSAGLRTVVAGRLDAAALQRLPRELVDMVAVRGAACRAGRASAVCRERVAALRDALTAP